MADVVSKGTQRAGHGDNSLQGPCPGDTPVGHHQTLLSARLLRTPSSLHSW